MCYQDYIITVIKRLHEQMYITEIVSELYDIKELPDGTFPLSFNIIDQYQREVPFLTEKLKCAEFTKLFFAEAGILKLV